MLAVFTLPIVGIASCNVLNRSGFCKSQMRWVSDDEKIAFAITNDQNKNLTKDERLQIAKSYRSHNPDCCRIYGASELIGGEDVVEKGLIERPAYITIKGGNPENVIVSSCADAWWPWRELPLPPGSDIP